MAFSLLNWNEQSRLKGSFQPAQQRSACLLIRFYSLDGWKLFVDSAIKVVT